MRTGGDDIAQALALIGAQPVWEPSSWRVTGFDIIPLARLGRPRVDVTLRISGFFRDAFPAQIELLDKAMRAVGALDEDEDDNPIAARMRSEMQEFSSAGMTEADARQLAGHRIFGSKPGAYGAGLQALIDEGLWTARADLAAAYVTWGAYAYGAAAQGTSEPRAFAERLKRIEAVVHNQDNREHDLLDSDDYYQFEGGMTRGGGRGLGPAPARLSQRSLAARASGDPHAGRGGRPGRCASRVVNPKWIAGVKRHGYKGAFEIAATVDYMFAFAATTGAVRSHHFDLAYDAFIADDGTRDFIRDNNREALREIAARLAEAAARGLWAPRLNSAYEQLRGACRMTETDDDNARHHEKMAKKKAARDKIMAGKTIEKGLLIVHTGKGKGKSTAAFGMVFRCIGHGMRAASSSSSRAHGRPASAWCWRSSPTWSPSRRWAKASPGKPRTARATSPIPAPPGTRPRR